MVCGKYPCLHSSILVEDKMGDMEEMTFWLVHYNGDVAVYLYSLFFVLSVFFQCS